MISMNFSDADKLNGFVLKSHPFTFTKFTAQVSCTSCKSDSVRQHSYPKFETCSHVTFYLLAFKSPPQCSGSI